MKDKLCFEAINLLNNIETHISEDFKLNWSSYTEELKLDSNDCFAKI